MSFESRVIDPAKLGLRPDATFTNEETIILRSLVAGKTVKQVRKSLHISESIFLNLLHEIWAKTGTANDPGLLVWAKRRMNSGDQRVGR
jgi:DNA-binding CsgD family transcriptional regulator